MGDDKNTSDILEILQGSRMSGYSYLFIINGSTAYFIKIKSCGFYFQFIILYLYKCTEYICDFYFYISDDTTTIYKL